MSCASTTCCRSTGAWCCMSPRSCWRAGPGWCAAGTAQDRLSCCCCWRFCRPFVRHVLPHVQGRPPVTNLYSSAIFVGWGAVVIGWSSERMFRDGIGAACSPHGRVHHPDHRPSPRVQWRHPGNDAGGAGQQFLAGHPCGGHHRRLFRDVPGRLPGDRLCRAGVFTRLLTKESAKALTAWCTA
jgi:hypothetical protein